MTKQPMLVTNADITQLSTLYSNAIARAEKAEEALRTGVQVKPLEWRAMWAETPFGCYKIDKIMSEPINGPGSPRSDEEVSYKPSFNGMTWGNIFGSMEMAKEYCQRHFDKRVLASVLPPPPVRETP